VNRLDDEEGTVSMCRNDDDDDLEVLATSCPKGASLLLYRLSSLGLTSLSAGWACKVNLRLKGARTW